MEVFTVLSSDNVLINRLIDHFLNDERIQFVGQDDDTIYLESSDSRRFYVHFENNFDEEMKINFKQEEEECIRIFFKNEEVFMLDISYNDSAFLYELLLGFTNEIELHSRESRKPLLFHDPFVGFVEINGFGRAAR